MSSGSRRIRNDPTPNEETWWEVVEIVAEDGKRYRVRWAGKDPKTGKPWPLSWVPNSHCSSELIKDWERKKGVYSPAALLQHTHMLNHTAKKETPLASSSSLQVPVARSRPTDNGSLTKSSESPVRTTHKRKRPSPSNADDNYKPSKKRKPVSTIDSQPGGNLERPSAHSHHTPDRAPPHPPFEEIEMWVPTPTAKFGPPKRKHVAAKRRDPPPERHAYSILSTATSVRTQTPLTVPKRPLSESQIIALREEEEESQPQPQHSVSRHSPQLGSPNRGPAPSDPLQTFTGDASGEGAGEVSQEVQDNRPTGQLSAESQPVGRNANTSHVSELRNEADHLQDNATNLSIQEGREELENSPTLPGPTRKSLTKPEVHAIIAPSTKSPLPERSDPRPVANATPSSVEQLGPIKDGPLRRNTGTLAERRASEARARLELLRRAASNSTGNLVEGQSSTSISPRNITQPPPHVVLKQVLNGLESPTQSQAVAMENSKIRRIPSEPREAGPSVEPRERMATRGKSDQHVDIGAANVSPRDNEPSSVPPTTQGSTQSQPPNASPQASLGSQLAAALDLLHTKSEEISELQAQMNALREQPTNGKVNPGDKRAGSEPPFSTQGTDHVAAGVQTDQEKEAQAAFDLERAQWSEEKTALQSETDALRADKAQALTDVEFFREQYQRASAFASTTRSENEELLARATLAESQSVNGIAMIRATFEGRVDKLETEVRKYKALSEMLIERARRTDDDVRYRAAIAPEFEREYQLLHRQFEEREAELDEIKDELRAEKKVNVRLRRLVARLKAEGQANGGSSHERKAPSKSSDDEDYVPGTSPSSSPPIENSSRSSPRDRQQEVHGPNNEEDVTMLTDQDVERLAGDDSASRSNDDMVYLCWWRSGEHMGSCDTVVTSKKASHPLHCDACADSRRNYTSMYFHTTLPVIEIQLSLLG
ncbi:hypothetical protein EDB85DRAFT_1083123 [Lactarius pseudohatsudake]|nr:hypothetical protein EDB85DRAFT_1083123 [Lactarius pseudohatsudake]